MKNLKNAINSLTSSFICTLWHSRWRSSDWFDVGLNVSVTAITVFSQCTVDKRSRPLFWGEMLQFAFVLTQSQRSLSTPPHTSPIRWASCSLLSVTLTPVSATVPACSLLLKEWLTLPGVSGACKFPLNVETDSVASEVCNTGMVRNGKGMCAKFHQLRWHC